MFKNIFLPLSMFLFGAVSSCGDGDSKTEHVSSGSSYTVGVGGSYKTPRFSSESQAAPSFSGSQGSPSLSSPVAAPGSVARVGEDVLDKQFCDINAALDAYIAELNSMGELSVSMQRQVAEWKARASSNADYSCRLARALECLTPLLHRSFRGNDIEFEGYFQQAEACVAGLGSE